MKKLIIAVLLVSGLAGGMTATAQTDSTTRDKEKNFTFSFGGEKRKGSLTMIRIVCMTTGCISKIV